MEFEVLELTGDHQVSPSPNLGENKRLESALIAAMLRGLNEGPTGRTFLVSWKGEIRVPQLELAGHQISWTQHGVVSNQEEEMIGSYERLQDLDGPNGDENAMLIKIWS